MVLPAFPTAVCFLFYCLIYCQNQALCDKESFVTDTPRRFLSKSVFSSLFGSKERKNEKVKTLTSSSSVKTGNQKRNPFTLLNKSKIALDRVESIEIKNLGMWKIELEEASFQLHNQFPYISQIYHEDLAQSWHLVKDKFPNGIKQFDDMSKMTLLNNNHRNRRNHNSIQPESFEYKINHLPTINENPNIAIVWEGSESEMHLQPWKFGHALGKTGGRRSCLRWYYEAQQGLGCFAGMECFWRDVIHYKLKHRTIISPEPTWERGACASAVRGMLEEEDGLCFLTPEAHHRRHSVPVPWRSPFSASTEEEVQNHIQMVSWEGRREYLASHVFPFIDIPNSKQRRSYLAHVKKLQEEKQRKKRKVRPSKSTNQTKASLEFEVKEANAYSAFGIRASEVVGARLRRALRGLCIEDKRCLGMDSNYEVLVSSASHSSSSPSSAAATSAAATSSVTMQSSSLLEVRHGDLSVMEKSIQPVSRRRVASSYLSSDFCLMPPLSRTLGPTRPGVFDALLAGCIPVFFSTCLSDRLAYETMYAPHFLPAHPRGNLSTYSSASSSNLGNHFKAGQTRDGVNQNDGFGVGSWAVLIDARHLRLNEDGEAYLHREEKKRIQNGEEEEEEEESNDNDEDERIIGDGSLDNVKENAKRIRSARQVMSYLASIPSSEKRRMRKKITEAIPRIQYAFTSTETSLTSVDSTQRHQKRKPSGTEDEESDPLMTSVAHIVSEILNQRFEVSTCSTVSCPLTKFSLADDIAFGKLSLGGGDDDMVGASPEFLGITDDGDNTQSESTMSYTTLKEDGSGDGWGTTGGILMTRTHRLLTQDRQLDNSTVDIEYEGGEDKEEDTEQDEGEEAEDDEELAQVRKLQNYQGTGMSAASFLSASSPKVCASKTARPLPSNCEVSDGSWFAARDHCEAVGARLCSASELRQGLGWNTGCHSSDKLLWTSTPCGDWTKNTEQHQQPQIFKKQSSVYDQRQGTTGGMYLLVNQAKKRERRNERNKLIQPHDDRKWGDLWRRRKLNEINRIVEIVDETLNVSRRLGGCTWSHYLHRVVCQPAQVTNQIGAETTDWATTTNSVQAREFDYSQKKQIQSNKPQKASNSGSSVDSSIDTSFVWSVFPENNHPSSSSSSSSSFSKQTPRSKQKLKSVEKQLQPNQIKNNNNNYPKQRTFKAASSSSSSASTKKLNIKQPDKFNEHKTQSKDGEDTEEENRKKKEYDEVEANTAYSRIKRSDAETIHNLASVCLSAFDFGFYELKPPSPICCADFHNEVNECEVPPKTTDHKDDIEVSGEDVDPQGELTHSLTHAKKRSAQRYANRIGSKNSVLGDYSSIMVEGADEQPNSVKDAQVIPVSRLNNRKKLKIAVLLFGPFGKAFDDERKEFSCNKRGLELQLEAANSQRKGFLVPLQLPPRKDIRTKHLVASSISSSIATEKVSRQHPPAAEMGFEIDLYIASSSSCGNEFDEQIRRAYAPFLKSLVYNDCGASEDKRCLLDVGLDMVETSFETYSFLLIGRPDTIFFDLRAPSLVADMVKNPNALSFAFKCASEEWSKWQCVADTLIALPGHKIQSFRKHCVGYRNGDAQCFHRINTHKQRRLSSSPTSLTSLNFSNTTHSNISDQFNKSLKYLDNEEQHLLRIKRRQLFVKSQSHKPPAPHSRSKHNVKTVFGYRPPEQKSFNNTPVEYIELETATERAKSLISQQQTALAVARLGGDGGSSPHDGRGCYQCALRMTKKHVVEDSVYQNSDFPGHDYQCFDVQSITSAQSGGQNFEAFELCAKSCSEERYPEFGRCVAWSMKKRSRPPHKCCLKSTVPQLIPASRVVSGILATYGGGFASVDVTIARMSEMRPMVEWRGTEKGPAIGNPYFSSKV